jgi:hypothetical protein
MPQFDTVTFLPQIFWLTVVFYIFYMTVIRDFLPGLTRIVKIRKKRLDAAQKTSSEFLEETLSTTNNYENLLVKSTDNFRTVLNNTVQEGDSWVNSSVSTLEHTNLAELNKDYILLNGKIKSKSYIVKELIKG